MRLLATLGALGALALPTAANAGADVVPNRYCEYLETPSIGVTVDRPNGGLLVCRTWVPGENGPTVQVFTYKV